METENNRAPPQPQPQPVPAGESFRNLIKALPDIVYVLDAAGRFLYLNDAVRSMGYDPEALTGKAVVTIGKPTSAALAASGREPDVIAAEATVDGAIEALARHWALRA